MPSAAAGSRSLAVALGANLDDPLATLLAVRPQLAELLLGWWLTPQAATTSAGPPRGARAAPEEAKTVGPADGPASPTPRLRWSPLFRTAPVGGPAEQPAYLNAVVVVDGGAGRAPADRPELQEALKARELLQRLLELERRFGRVRAERWGPRRLDLDLLWCGSAALELPELSLPHPRLRERAFVLAPLAALDPELLVPGARGEPEDSVRVLLEGLPPQALEPPPQRLGGRSGWPE